MDPLEHPSRPGSPSDRIPAEVLARPVSGVNLAPGPLRTQLGEDPKLLVFLRHFGCIFCRETVADLRSASALPGFPAVIFFFQGRSAEGRAFLRRDWPGVPAIADPELRFYDAFGVGRMSALQLLRPGLWTAEWRARGKDLEPYSAERSGDVWRMPGVFLVRSDRVLWGHDFRHAGDAVDFRALPALTRRLAGAAAEREPEAP